MIALVMFLSLAGCVQRRLTIRSNPPGALVYVDDFVIGTTPVSTDFIYYGTREIKLVKDGYETITVNQRISPPWYQIFPLDFFSENVIPWEIRDERGVDFQMVPQQVMPVDQLLERAENLRNTSQMGGTMFPAGATTLPVAPPPVQPEFIPPPGLLQQGIPSAPYRTNSVTPLPAVVPGGLPQ